MAVSWTNWAAVTVAAGTVMVLADGVTELLGAEAGPVPAEFTALTVKGVRRTIREAGDCDACRLDTTNRRLRRRAHIWCHVVAGSADARCPGHCRRGITGSCRHASWRGWGGLLGEPRPG